MSTRTDLGDQDSVSTVYASQEHSSPLNITAAREHGTRPPISPHCTCEILIDDADDTPSTDSDVDEANTNAKERPPPAPSISDVNPPLYLSLPPNSHQRAKKGCLKQASPLSSPSLSSPESSPALNYATFYHTLGGPGSSPLTPGSIGRRSRGDSGSSTPRKTVSWCSHDQKGLGYLEEVFPADDWDRTPTEPARTPLSYKDILELKAIQRTLPHAQQLPDPFTGKPASQYLSNVPIALLPLLPDSAPHTPSSTPNISPTSSTGATPSVSGSNTPSTISPRGSRRGSPEQSTQVSPRSSPRGSPVPSPARSPSHSPERGDNTSPLSLPVHAHSPRISSPLAPLSGTASPCGNNTDTLAPPGPGFRARPKLTFNFVPLLDTPPTSPPSSVPTSPPTHVFDSIPQALNAALGNLCNGRRRNESFSQNEEDSPPPTPALTVTSLGGDSCSEVDTELSDIGEDVPFGVMFRKDAEGSYDSYACWRGRPGEGEVGEKKKKKSGKEKKERNVFYINGEAIDLDGDEDGSEEDEDEERKPSTTTTSAEGCSSANVIYINGEACSLDDSIDLPTPKLSRPRTSSSPPRTRSSFSRRSRTPSPPPVPLHTVEDERKSRFSHGPVSPFHRAHPNVSARTSSPESETEGERKPRSQVPISAFHRAHPNVARMRTPSPGVEREKSARSHSPISPFHRAHPNVVGRGVSPSRD